jgi:hypothetical protein
MTMKRAVILTFVVAFALVGAMAASGGDYTYVGVKSCKMCHNKADTGAQFKVWSESAHAKAFASLATPESKAKAKEMGIDDPQKDPKCLKCHVTGYAVASDSTQKVVMEDGVTCESCHGPGSGYKSMKVMKAITAGETKPETVGLIMPDEKTCLGCHVAEGNPFHKEFKYDEYVKKIAHPDPTIKKSK